MIFGIKPNENERKNKPIFFIDDNRIFTISGVEYEDEKLTNRIGTINYFDYIVNNLIPNLDAFRKDDDLLDKFVLSLKQETKKDEDR